MNIRTVKSEYTKEMHPFCLAIRFRCQIPEMKKYFKYRVMKFIFYKRRYKRFIDALLLNKTSKDVKRGVMNEFRRRNFCSRHFELNFIQLYTLINSY